MSEPRFGRIALEGIVMDMRTQSRASIDVEVVEEYAKLMQEGVQFPAIVVFENAEDDTFFLSEGWHRMMAAKQAAKEDIMCDIRQGDIHDAVLNSSGANATHGVRRTREDKRRAVTMLLDSEKWNGMSVSALAAAASVSRPLVDDIINELNAREPESDAEKTQGAELHPEEEPQTVIGKDGKTYPKDGGKGERAKPQKAKKATAESDADPATPNVEPSTEDAEQPELEHPGHPTCDALHRIADTMPELPRLPEEAVTQLAKLGGWIGGDRAHHIAWWFTEYVKALDAAYKNGDLDEALIRQGLEPYSPEPTADDGEAVESEPSGEPAVTVVDEENEEDELQMPAFLKKRETVG